MNIRPEHISHKSCHAHQTLFIHVNMMSITCCTCMCACFRITRAILLIKVSVDRSTELDMIVVGILKNSSLSILPFSRLKLTPALRCSYSGDIKFVWNTCDFCLYLTILKITVLFPRKGQRITFSQGINY